MNHHSRVARAIVAILAMSAISMGLSSLASAEDVTTRIDADGTLHVRQITIPPSDLWSAEFKKFYATLVSTAARSGFPAFKVPARNATTAEWDKFDALMDDRYLAEPLAWVLERYPVDVLDTKIAGVRVGIISPKNGIAPENQRRVLINLHGGGFVYYRGLLFGQLEAIPVASIGRIKVITVDYRQAPFHRFPAASEDVEAIYKALLKQYKAEAIGIFGCSAGGILTAQAVAWFQAKGLPRPGAVGIFCSAPAPTWARAGGRLGDAGTWSNVLSLAPKSDGASLEPVRWYMEAADRDDPKAYPGSSDAVLAEFPPTLLLSGTRDFPMSEVIVAHARFLKLGVQASLYIMEGGTHAAHVMAVDTPEAYDANAYVARWFARHLAR